MLLLFPPYSPDINPTEKIWSAVKAMCFVLEFMCPRDISWLNCQN